MSGSKDWAAEQYVDDANLTARINLHRRFSTSPTSWNRWVFDQMRLPDNALVLEVGAGTGLLWSENGDRLPAGLQLILSDSSEGMLKVAAAQLAGLPGVEFRHMYAATMPDANQSVDIVIANHMLYHVPDRPAVFGEVVRVLRPSGRFYAATNGASHMRELDDLIGKPKERAAISATAFSLENGSEQLSQYFGLVRLIRHDNSLAVTDASAVLAYIRSLPWNLSEIELGRIGETVRDMIRRDGAFRITRDSGLFICAGPGRVAT
jgi:ubiquinone/menaquinone biosynthesis C-methylase UbiE